ncbi:protein of unknown function [Methylocaldum szegediense]|uniref:Uncharacterized protein n=1 Tax=Methylocaldum szegediense TaxID=73780 RepID=A0ABM9I3W7_9GAMM|nr:protein of unknown function [Methylocaldum szegediense]
MTGDLFSFVFYSFPDIDQAFLKISTSGAKLRVYVNLNSGQRENIMSLPSLVEKKMQPDHA